MLVNTPHRQLNAVVPPAHPNQLLRDTGGVSFLRLQMFKLHFLLALAFQKLGWWQLVAVEVWLAIKHALENQQLFSVPNGVLEHLTSIFLKSVFARLRKSFHVDQSFSMFKGLGTMSTQNIEMGGDSKFNTVCPYSLINKNCKQDQKGGKCSLRKAYLLMIKGLMMKVDDDGG